MKNQTVTLPLDVIYKLSAETERSRAYLELCYDSLRLHSVLGLEHIETVLRELADNAFEVLEMLNKLQSPPMVERALA